MLTLPNAGPEFEEICGWHFLLGGRYIITYHENGRTSVWDSEHVRSEQKEASEQGSKSQAVPVGRRLATYEIGFWIWQTQTYHTYGG